MTATHGLQSHATEPGQWLLYRITKTHTWRFMARIFAGTPIDAQHRAIELLDSHKLPHGHTWQAAPNKTHTYGLLTE